jgi:predicted small secreted protein
MNKKLVFLGILLLVGLTLAGCVTVGGYGYGYDYSYGYYGYPHGYGPYHYGYGFPHRDLDDYHRGSDHGPGHGR